jgi:hypothetical protein
MLPWKRWSLALAALVLLLPGLALADSRVVIDHVAYDAKEKTLTMYVDVLDVKGNPVENLSPADLKLTASGKPLVTSDIQLQTAQDAGEPIAVVLLLNASRAYQAMGESEEHSTYQQEKEGAASFIKMLSGNDKVAVVQYREGFPHEVVYSFASDFKQAAEAVSNATVPDGDALPENNLGKQVGTQTLSPEIVRAIDKSMNYLAENLEKLGSARRRFIVIMSDGKDRETRKDKLISKIQNVLDKYEEYKIRIHAIGYTADDPMYLPLLQTVANSTGGVYKGIDPSAKEGFGSIPSVWDSIAGRIKKQYVIKAVLADIPEGGEPVKGKDEVNHVIGLSVAMKDGAVSEAVFNDVRMPKPSIAWGAILKWVSIVVGGLLGIGLIIFLIVFVSRRKGSDEGSGSGGNQRQEYDGPSRGKLVVLAGPLAGETFPLIDDVTTIGSMKGNTIVIQDGSVSRRHAAIKIDQMRYEVADMNSTNGILVNGQRVHKVFLKDGDRIHIGSTEVQFNLK